MCWQLVVEAGQRKGLVVPVLRTPFVIGREPGCHLRPAAPDVSRRHCSLEADGGRLLVVDHWTTNGTFVNGRRVEEKQELHPGDRLRIGPLEFRIGRVLAPPVPDRAPSCEDLAGDMLLAMDEEENALANATNLLSVAAEATAVEGPARSSLDTRPDHEAVGAAPQAPSRRTPARNETAGAAKAILAAYVRRPRDGSATTRP